MDRDPTDNNRVNRAISPFGVRELETTQMLLLFFEPERVSSFFSFLFLSDFHFILNSI